MRRSSQVSRKHGWNTSRTMAIGVLLCAGLAVLAPALHAQSRVGADSSTRTRRYRHDLLYGTALGFVYAGVDQARNDPPQWGRDGRGYGRRLASDVGEFVVQETVTDVIAAGMNRPLDYQHCGCQPTGQRIGWALKSAITDPMPDGTRAFALPRVVGAYAGSFAQAAWRPEPTSGGRTRVALVNGTVSLLIGAAINTYYELR